MTKLEWPVLTSLRCRLIISIKENLMTALPDTKRKYTIEEYIELLKNSDERFEFFDGEIVSMAGGKLEHGGIGVNISGELRNRLRERPCRVFNGDVAIKTILAPPFRFPDVSVVCGEVLSEDFNRVEMLLNPLFICEVLSPTTANYDREEKFLAYQAIDSFQEYLLVEQQRPHVTHYLRQPKGGWLRSDIIGMESEIKLESLGVTLPLSEIYRLVKFPEVTTEAVEQPA
jgi:Uma2 family endonuclease